MLIMSLSSDDVLCICIFDSVGMLCYLQFYCVLYYRFIVLRAYITKCIVIQREYVVQCKKQAAVSIL
jgi:hypothetical protein